MKVRQADTREFGRQERAWFSNMQTRHLPKELSLQQFQGQQDISREGDGRGGGAAHAGGRMLGGQGSRYLLRT